MAPKLCAQLHNSWQKKDWKTFAKVRDALMPLHKTLFAETNPAPAKYCLSKLGKIENSLRLPLLPVSAPTRKLLDAAMKEAGVKK